MREEAENTEEYLSVSGSSGTGIEITCHKSCPYYKRIEEVIRAILPRAEARGPLAYV